MAYQQQQYYVEPQYKTRPTWELAWGLMWRQAIMLLPLYIILAIIGISL